MKSVRFSPIVHNYVAASTQNQALNALVFLYRKVLKQEFGDLDGISPAKRPARLPVVFDRDEVKRILCALEGTHGLIGSLLYGSGLRLLECLRLRVQDLEFGLRQDGYAIFPHDEPQRPVTCYSVAR